MHPSLKPRHACNHKSFPRSPLVPLVEESTTLRARCDGPVGSLLSLGAHTVGLRINSRDLFVNVFCGPLRSFRICPALSSDSALSHLLNASTHQLSSPALGVPTLSAVRAHLSPRPTPRRAGGDEVDPRRVALCRALPSLDGFWQSNGHMRSVVTRECADGCAEGERLVAPPPLPR